MVNHVADYLAVEVEDHQHGYGVGEGENCRDEDAYLIRVGEIVEAAAGEEAFRDKTTPHAHDGHQAPGQDISPDQDDEHHHLATRELAVEGSSDRAGFRWEKNSYGLL